MAAAKWRRVSHQNGPNLINSYLNTTMSASHAAFGYMSNYSPQVEGVNLPSEGCAGAFNLLAVRSDQASNPSSQ